MKLIENAEKKPLRIFHSASEWDVGSQAIPNGYFFGEGNPNVAPTIMNGMCMGYLGSSEGSLTNMTAGAFIRTSPMYIPLQCFLNGTYYGNTPRMTITDHLHMNWPLAGNRTA